MKEEKGKFGSLLKAALSERESIYAALTELKTLENALELRIGGTIRL
jgi:hypothetical protein